MGWDLQQRRPLPAAETGRSCWGSGQQDANAAQGVKQTLGAATRGTKQQPTGLIAYPAAQGRAFRIPPDPASPVDIPEDWDPRTKQQPTGLVAYPAAQGRAFRIPPVRYKNSTRATWHGCYFYGPGGIRTLDLSDANRTLSQQYRFCAHLMHREKRKINVYSSI